MNNAKEKLIFVGSYTQPVPHAPHAAGPGIVTLRLLLEEGTVHEVRRTNAEITGANPSYVCTNGEDVFAANEVAEGSITQLRVDESGGLSLVCRATCGSEPCHVATVEEGVVAGCFGDGSVWSYLLNEKRLTLADRWDCPEGKGVHQTLPLDDGRIIVCNPVAGVIHVLSRSPNGKLSLQKSVIQDGYPRHAAFHAGVLHVACAKSRTVVSLDGELGTVARMALPEGSGVLGGIKTFEQDVLVSERGEGNNRIWRLRKTGKPICWDSGGRTPRDLAVLGRWVVVAHQDCGTVSVSIGEIGGDMRAVLREPQAAFVCLCTM